MLVPLRTRGAIHETRTSTHMLDGSAQTPMNRLAFIPLLALACATPILHPSEIRVEELDWGVYILVDGREQLVSQTDQLPCRSDARFGFRAELFFPNDRTVRLPVVIEITEPPVPGHRPASTIAPDDLFIAPQGISSYAISVVNAFKSDADLVDGTYKVRLIEPETRLAYHERTFVLRNCEAKFVAAPMPDLSAATPQHLPSNEALQIPTNSAFPSRSWSLLASIPGASETSAALVSAADRPPRPAD